ncbi:1,4-alpha-glucan branching protein domain-containing protein [Effusibacillus pohliae]|uniref:1,4-alpha-glucan branching protein domain-containing protein n=1 Tax=Effusibacillus pohliae TaxID=232270 RepID=UPI000368AF14|nr:1,4-alpha-glucan branching protein domain-containing protein [Effusibacillus pohliae]
MAKGYLALVLHAHLPYVRHPESEHFLEERWMFEAMTETYIPLLQVYHGLLRDGVDFRVTMSLTPTLVSMLTDPLLQKRYLNHLNKLIELAEKEVIRTAGSPEFNRLAVGYRENFAGIRDFYRRYDGNLVTAFRELQELGKLELITSAATHAFLPLVMTEEAIRAQIRTAIDLHESHFGRPPRGIWLPECGFKPDLDRILQECGIEYFFTDSHGVKLADPAPVFGTLSPVLTPHGVAAFPRDEESSKQVWSSQEGYPGDYEYREYYRDIGYDLDFDIIQPYLHPDGIRINTGIKYYRITGKGDHKEPYDPHRAREKAAEHAGHFMFNRQKQVEHWAFRMGRKPIVVAPYDAELFGHWWYEGPVWIDMLLRKIHFDQDTVKTITPSEYLRLYSDYQVCRLPMSSWGRNGYADVWLRGENDWIYPALHAAERRMIELANRFQEPRPVQQRALNQAARELMLAQSSDWAFIMDNKTMVDYAVKRTKYHINRFMRLYGMLKKGAIDEPWLIQLEQLDRLFPDLDYRVYRSRHPVARFAATRSRPRVLMLTWEFPPMTVGGLARHVYDLSRYLVRHGWEVHVVTSEIGEYPHDEVVDGVHVHRVHVMKPDGGEFVHWAFQLNLMMIDACQMLIDSGLTFDLIHAHDWLVCYAAKTIKHMYHLPLVATIHATEHGRNEGIYTDLQQYISHLEWRLTYEAQRVIVCSTYMRREVETIFQLPADKLDVIPNGVDPELLQPKAAVDRRDKQRYAMDHERIVLFIGRLVREKGVHTLLEAAPAILAEFPDVKFVIAGKGPAAGELQQLAERMGVREKVLFTGFIPDDERNRLLQIAEVAVFPSRYEPFGIVALEAMAAGTAVVVSDVGGLGDVVQHGHNGLKMYPGDAHSLATQVKDLLRDPHWASGLAQTALAEIGRFDWNRIAEQTIGVYGKIANVQQSSRASFETAAAAD